MSITIKAVAFSAMALLFHGVSPAADSAPSKGTSFTIAVIPDTQNYIDYQHQEDQGYPLNGRDLFFDQMRFIAKNLRSQGGDIDFVTAVGDVWQHQRYDIDPDSASKGYKSYPSALAKAFGLGPDQNYQKEVAHAIDGYRLIDGKVPFSVAPGNHDYDSMYVATKPAEPSGSTPLTQDTPIAEVVRRNGIMAVGGLSTFRAVFGADSSFFKGKEWYVGSHDGGGDSAQIFIAGGYRFLHIALQFDPSNASLAWASEMIRQYPGLPTIVTTHDYLNTAGERRANPAIDQSASHPDANAPQGMWDKFISQNDQIFMVLCGHQHAQSRRVDDNRFGHKVYQILADYQDREHLLEGKQPKKGMVTGLGDGWLRLMTFDMTKPVPVVHIRTFSSYYKGNSVNTAGYAEWYKAKEHPKMSDGEFMAEDDFTIDLTDFRNRFRM